MWHLVGSLILVAARLLIWSLSAAQRSATIAIKSSLRYNLNISGKLHAWCAKTAAGAPSRVNRQQTRLPHSLWTRFRPLGFCQGGGLPAISISHFAFDPRAFCSRFYTKACRFISFRGPSQIQVRGCDLPETSVFSLRDIGTNRTQWIW